MIFHANLKAQNVLVTGEYFCQYQKNFFNFRILGGPRLANCGRKKVFNNATGQCSDPKDVPGW